jgi:anti-sigma-K factor RskA
MTNGEDMAEFGDDDVLAGEYVLGVLDAEARDAAEARLAADPGFAVRVARWRDDLSSLDAAYAATPAPPGLYPLIEKRLFGEAPPAAARPFAGVWQSLTLWRGLTFASLVLVAGLVAANIGLWRQPGEMPGGATLVAELSSDDAPIDLVALYYASSGAISITPVAAEPEAGQSLQLWLIDGDGPPLSLGVLPEDGRGELVVGEDLRALFAEGAVLAISLEPEGGSPTGAPTGPVIAAGAARAP